MGGAGKQTQEVALRAASPPKQAVNTALIKPWWFWKTEERSQVMLMSRMTRDRNKAKARVYIHACVFKSNLAVAPQYVNNVCGKI